MIRFEFEMSDADAENLLDCIEDKRIALYLQAIDPKQTEEMKKAFYEAAQYLDRLKLTVAKGSKRVTR